MLADFFTFRQAYLPNAGTILKRLYGLIQQHFCETEVKIWHRHPVWFLIGNSIVGFSVQKRGLRLMFWSGADFEEKLLSLVGGMFKDASIFYNALNDVDVVVLNLWLKKSRVIQWDYKNIVKRKGKLERLR